MAVKINAADQPRTPLRPAANRSPGMRLAYPAAHFAVDLKSVEKRLRDPKINTIEPVEIIPHSAYGKPSVFSYKVFQAVIKKLSDYGYPVPETVSFGSREIMRLSHRSWYGSANAKELVKTLNQFKHTAINCWFYDKATKTGANLSLSLINKFLYTYQGRGGISHFTLWVDPWFVKSINNYYTFCLTFSRIEKLEPIGTALYKHLYFHFSNLYSKSNSKNVVFRKEYKEICRTWLGGLKVLPYRSKILQEQLGRHLEAVKKTRLIKNYAIEKRADGDGFNLICHAGSGFFDDYEHFYRRRMQYELPFVFAADENTIQKPLELVLYFHQQLNGSDAAPEFGFSEKETAFASSLLEKHSEDQAKAFIDYGIDEAKKTNFEIRSIGGLKKYHASYLKTLQEKEKTKAREIKEQKKREEARRHDAYEAYRATEITRIRAALSSQEIEQIENDVRHELEAKHPGAKIFSAWIRKSVDQHLGEKKGLLPFEKWEV